MNRRSLLGLGLLIATVVLLATSCGSSSKNATATLSKADFAKAMNNLCVQATASTKGLGAVNGMADIAAVGPGYVTALQGLLDRLKKLEPPTEIKTQVDDYISKTSGMVGPVNDLIAAAKKNDSVAFVKISASAGPKVQAASKAVNADARAIGAPDCESF
jgi:hypothetical protein